MAYVRFAVTHRPYFEVMYRPELYDREDQALLRARSAAAFLLYGSDDPGIEALSEGVAAWAIVHGVATLWTNGALPPELGADPEQITRIVASRLDISRAL